MTRRGLLSRYRIRDIRLIPLDNGVEKMAYRAKRLGRQAAVAARGLRVENPVVIHDLREGGAAPMSDHDAIGVDVVV